MKRLLTYLFVFFGLGLVFSANANADAVFPSGPDRGACVSTSKNIKYKFSLKKKKLKCFYWISHKEYPDVYNNIAIALYSNKPKNRDTALYLLKGTYLEVLIKENTFKTSNQLNNSSKTKLKKTIEAAKKKAVENRKKELLLAQKKAEEEEKKKKLSQTQKIGKKAYFCEKKNLSLLNNVASVYISKNGCFKDNEIDEKKYLSELIPWKVNNFLKSIGRSNGAYARIAVNLKKEYLENNLNTNYLEETLISKQSSFSGKLSYDKPTTIGELKVALKAVNKDKNNKTQIAKAEPSQTQSNENSYSVYYLCLNTSKDHHGYVKVQKYSKENNEKCENKVYAKQHKSFYFAIQEKRGRITPSSADKKGSKGIMWTRFMYAVELNELISKENEKGYKFAQFPIITSTQVAKKNLEKDKNNPKLQKVLISKRVINHKKNKRIVNDNKWVSNVSYCYRPNTEILFLATSYNGNCKDQGAVNAGFDGENFYFFSDSKTQIAKPEPTVKPKKKVKVAKVEKPKQEEFKPKKTNKDNEAPVIEIAEVITVNDTDYEFQGKVTDQAKTIYVEVDGRPTDVKNGKFIVKGYSPIDKQISIEAIDQWGNRSEPRIVKLKIDIKDTSIAEKLEPLNPSKIRSKSSNDKVALIIGIENYLESPNASYANLDAKYFFDYARKGFGVKKQNINLLVDEDATFVKTNKALTKWLRSKIKTDQSDLIIFFAGHGLASSDGKELYLLPQDGDPDLLSRTALSRTELFQEIIDLNPKSVTMFLDTCYSGVSRDEQTLLASARPIRIVAGEQESIPNNFTIFTASKLNQISSGIKEAKHGIFSYYLMKGLEGNADSNNDKNITNGELLAYMDENVSQKAAEQGREQNPSLAGDPDKILISYR